ncbi:MAG: hypothetical protein K8F27_05495 [Sulfuricellaceae bacterium]|nr:hypothetical protein [Sulfuricellaceae bacterium]
MQKSKGFHGRAPSRLFSFFRRFIMAAFVPRLKAGLVSASLLILAGSSLGASPAWAFNVDVYRGVDVNAANGRATLSPSQFRFNPDLSTFNTAAATGKPCNYRFTITGVANNPAQQGDQGTVLFAGASLPVGVYTATFNNIPLGHWRIDHPGTINADAAKLAIGTYAQANRGNIVGGTFVPVPPSVAVCN